MSSGPHHGSSTLALARTPRDADDAEIIDLVQLPRGTRPTPIACLEYEEVARCRQMDCDYYQSCLNFAARVRWRSFHCRQCPLHPDRTARAQGAGADGAELDAAIIQLR